MKYYIAGAGGFIGGHLVNRLINSGHEVVAVDVKNKNEWFQINDKSENFFECDLKILKNCEETIKDVDVIINLACNMGGIGFITSYKAECMLSVLINTNLLMQAKEKKIKKYFFSSSACIYPTNIQSDEKSVALKEETAYPANSEDGYGWEKLFSERMCKHFFEDFNIQVSVARFHNCYGPNGSWFGGREKAPAALARKFVEAKVNNSNKIEIWGNGEQVRSFMYVDDCLDGILKLIESDFRDPINIGSSEDVTINQMVDILENISGIKPERNYKLDAPRGVFNRNSDNTLIKKKLNWEPSIKLKDGLKVTFDWIFEEYKKKYEA